MDTERWFSNLLDDLKDDFDFRLESIILDLTEQIAKRMKEKRITRKELADLLNVSPPAITKILNGTSNFTLKTLLSLADALELDLVIDFKERDTRTFQVVDAHQYGVTSEMTADVAFNTFGEAVFVTFKDRVDFNIYQQAEMRVTSGTSIEFAESGNAAFSFGWTCGEIEKVESSQRTSRRKTMGQEAA